VNIMSLSLRTSHSTYSTHHTHNTSHITHHTSHTNTHITHKHTHDTSPTQDQQERVSSLTHILQDLCEGIQSLVQYEQNRETLKRRVIRLREQYQNVVLFSNKLIKNMDTDTSADNQADLARHKNQRCMCVCVLLLLLFILLLLLLLLLLVFIFVLLVFVIIVILLYLLLLLICDVMYCLFVARYYSVLGNLVAKIKDVQKVHM